MSTEEHQQQRHVSRWRETIGHGFGTGRHKGTNKTWAVQREDNGKLGGYQTEHWDDSLDANVIADAGSFKYMSRGGDDG